MDRSLRRHHIERLRKRAINIGRNIWATAYDNYWVEQWLLENYETLQQCHRICCRNPRRSLGHITRQEKIANYNFKEQIKEWRKRAWRNEH